MKHRKINKLVMLAVVTTALFAITASPIFIQNAEAASHSKHGKSKKKSKTDDSKDAGNAASSSQAVASSAPSPTATSPAAPPVSTSAPIRVAFINASEGAGDKVFGTIDSLWDKYPDVTRIDNDTVDQTAQAYGISKSDLPDAGSRSKHLKNIRQMMSDLQADTLIIVQVTGKGGKKATLTTLSTKGKEIDQERKNIRRGKISKRDAKKLLDASLKKARPVVDDFRKAGGWTPPPVAPVPPPEAVAAAAPGDATTGTDQPVGEAAPTEAAVAEAAPEKSPNDFLGHTHLFSAAIYGSYAYNSNLLQNKNKDGQDYAIGLPGGALSLSSTFVHFGQRVALGASLFGGFSYEFMTENATNPKNAKKLPSYLAFGQLQLNVPIAITKNFMVVPYVGGDFQKFDIKQDKDNLIYHGQQFIGARGGLMFNVYAQGFSADFGGGVVPVFLASYPDNRYEIDTKSFLKALAYEGRATFTYEITPLIAVVAGYNFRLLPAKLKVKQDTLLISTKTAKKGSSLDYSFMSHYGFAGVQINL